MTGPLHLRREGHEEGSTSGANALAAAPIAHNSSPMAPTQGQTHQGLFRFRHPTPPLLLVAGPIALALDDSNAPRGLRCGLGVAAPTTRT